MIAFVRHYIDLYSGLSYFGLVLFAYILGYWHTLLEVYKLAYWYSVPRLTPRRLIGRWPSCDYG